MARQPSVNLCPDCGELQYHAPGSGWTCENGHGYGDPNGPKENAAPTPQHVLRSSRSKATRPMQVTFSIAESRYSPVSYQSFGVGPFSATVTIEPGDDPKEVVDEAKQVLLDIARDEYMRAVESYAKALSFNDRYVKEFMARRGLKDES